MISKSKYEVDEKTIVRLFEKADIFDAMNIAPLGAGEFNSVYSVDAGGKAYAIKIAPVGSSGILTYETDMMRQEVYYYSLMEQAGISVPAIYYSDFSMTDIPTGYFIMQRLDGQQLDKIKLDEEESAEATIKTAGMVARMHSVKGEKFGYMQNGLHGNWYIAITEIVKNLIKDANNFGKNTKRGDKLLKFIEHNKTILEKVDCRLINFDIWPPNIFCKRADGAELTLSWIDPERCLFGDRIADFVCLEFMKMSLDKKEISINAYNKVSDTQIVITDNERVRYAIMLGYLGLIMEVEKYARYSPRHFGWWRNVLASKMLFSNAFKQLKKLNGKR